MYTETGFALLGDIADIRTSYQSRGGIDVNAASPYRIIQLRDVKETIDWETVVTFNPERAPERHLVVDGDVLLSCRGEGHVGIPLSGVPANAVASGNFYVLRARTGLVLPAYLAWYLNQPAAQEFLERRSQGTRVALLTRADVSELEVPIPSLTVQERVVSLADLRRTERNLLRRLEEKRDMLVTTICNNAVYNAAGHTEA